MPLFLVSLLLLVGGKREEAGICRNYYLNGWVNGVAYSCSNNVVIDWNDVPSSTISLYVIYPFPSPYYIYPHIHTLYIPRPIRKAPPSPTTIPTITNHTTFLLTPRKPLSLSYVNIFPLFSLLSYLNGLFYIG
jgi:hypothetical protein